MSSTTDKLSNLKEKLRLLESNVCIAEIKSNVVKKTKVSNLNEKLNKIKESQDDIISFNIRGLYEVSFSKSLLLNSLDNVLISIMKKNKTTIENNPFIVDFDSINFYYFTKILIYFQDKPKDKTHKFELKLSTNSNQNQTSNEPKVDVDFLKFEFEIFFNGNKFEDYVNLIQ